MEFQEELKNATKTMEKAYEKYMEILE